MYAQEESDFGGAWSSDGRLYFTSHRNADLALGVATVDGSAVACYSKLWIDDSRLGSPRQALAFTSDRDRDAEIYISLAGGGRLTKLHEQRVDDFVQRGHRAATGSPSFACPTTTRRAVGCGRRRPQPAATLRADLLQYPEWSPNGRWIAVKLDANIAVIPSSGGHPRLVAWQAPAAFPPGPPTARSWHSRRSETATTRRSTVPLGGRPTRRVTDNDVSESC